MAFGFAVCLRKFAATAKILLPKCNPSKLIGRSFVRPERLEMPGVSSFPDVHKCVHAWIGLANNRRMG